MKCLFAILLTCYYLAFFAYPPPLFGQVIIEEPPAVPLGIGAGPGIEPASRPFFPRQNPSLENRLPLTEPKESEPKEAEPKEPDEFDRIDYILNFWFGELPGPNYFPQDKMPIWFSATPEVDRQIRDNFLRDIELAGSGNLNSWRHTARGRLALILLLDQFPRRIWRNGARSYMFDRMARALMLEGIRKGDDKELYPIERAFFYLPLEHSEDLDEQNLSVFYFRSLVETSPEYLRPIMNQFLQSAILHRRLIENFGRFPYRNDILERESTPQELMFLRQSKGGI